MSPPVLMADPETGNVALFDEAPGGGDPADRNALRNRPLLDPEAWLANVYFHSTMDCMEVHSDTTVVVAHAEISPAANTTGIELASAFDYNSGVTDYELVTHDLGYAPLVLVAINNELLTPGQPIHGPGVTGGSVRYVSPWVSNTKVMLREYASRGVVGLSTANFTYRVLVLRRPRLPQGKRLIDFDPATGVLAMGFDKFSSDRRYLQVVPGGSPFGLCLGRNADVRNGAPRFVTAGYWVHESVSSDTRMGIKAGSEVSVTYGDPMNYTGPFIGNGSIGVQAP